MADRKLRIALCHPDLGIGGAERVAVDAAVELSALGHHVHIFTAHHDKKRCFEETIDGSFPVTVYGDFLPRHVFNRLHAVCAYIRCVYVAICMVLLWPKFDVVFADQVSAVIPVLKLKRGCKVLFYCHFPDMLLAQHTTRLRRLYRAPLNWIEETTTDSFILAGGCLTLMSRGADGPPILTQEWRTAFLVNSEFTASTFGSTFTRLQARGLHPAVLYPAVDVRQFDTCLDNPPDVTFIPGLSAEGHIFLSINRFERKKNIALAISAFATLVRQQENSQLTSVPRQLVRLVVAGGYDKRLAENREYLQELKTLATEEGVVEQVIFVPSCSTLQRNALLAACVCVLYTPMNEHFGIVPLEAMAAQRPVVACNSGGPEESIQNAKTGYLCEPTPGSFASAMALILQDSSRAEIMGKNARKHVEENFSRQVFGERLNSIIYNLLEGSL